MMPALFGHINVRYCIQAPCQLLQLLVIELVYEHAVYMPAKCATQHYDRQTSMLRRCAEAQLPCMSMVHRHGCNQVHSKYWSVRASV